jgi:hypothetical protein
MKGRTVKAVIGSVVIIGAVIAVLAFANLHQEKTVKSLPTTALSKGFAVVELFTSEGCSSCPPADDFIRELQKVSKNDKLYVLAYHVDYWNRLGWKDKFSDPDFSKRQYQYANWLNHETVFTPEIVINGKKEFIGSDKNSIIDAIADGLGQDSTGPLPLKCRIMRDQIRVECPGKSNKEDSQLSFALVQRFAQDEVKAGENQGRTLSHVQIVRRLIYAPAGENGVTMDLPQNFRLKDWELIGILQDNNTGRVKAAGRTNL